MIYFGSGLTLALLPVWYERSVPAWGGGLGLLLLMTHCHFIAAGCSAAKLGWVAQLERLQAEQGNSSGEREGKGSGEKQGEERMEEAGRRCREGRGLILNVFKRVLYYF